ncbi:MAG TPA: bifunctional metallophosphatase/5'-nucleotidase [Flavisolibacter sp.]|nr:bifunctional metallophosphatase/5'-nucleotidase [Flavisolibacter sp.]
MKNFLHFSFVMLVLTSCSSTRNALSKDDRKIDVTFVQINDVYEIAPLSGGKEGGMARVATLKKEYKQKNPNTFLVMAGDFVSPSVYNSLQYEGKAIRGKQMVEAMNAAGMDFAIFGNHEFDIKESELQERINESNFQWISSNAFHKTASGIVPFTYRNTTIPKTFVLNVKDADGTSAKIGFVGVVLPFNKADFVSYTDALSTAKDLYNQLKDSVDAVVAITHQSIEEDERLAKEIPGLAAILGGHEHDQRFEKVGNIYITKAMANAKSAYVINLAINKKKNKIKVTPKLEKINETVAIDSVANAVVQKWQDIAEKNYSSLGFDAKRVLISKGEPLDGRESEIRSHPTNLTKLIVASIADAVPNADVVLMNSGSIRVDDILQAPITEYDIIRTLPFGGGIREVDMKGSLLIKTLEQGKKNIGIGGYLLYNENLVNANDKWLLNTIPIDPSKTYHVAITDFLLTGKEANLDYLNPTNVDVVKTYDAVTSITDPRSDVRLAVVKYLGKQ